MFVHSQQISEEIYFLWHFVGCWKYGNGAVKAVCEVCFLLCFQQEPQNSTEEDASSDNSQFTGSTINLQDLEWLCWGQKH